MIRRFMTSFAIVSLLLVALSPALAGDRSETVKTTFAVQGMHCGGCSSAIRGAMEKIEGVVSASADHEKASAEAVYNPGKVKPEQLKEAIEKLGYTVTSMETAPTEDS